MLLRASRVQSTPSSIFRNSKQYLQSNELFYRTMEEGGYQQSKNHQNHQKQNKQQKSNQTQKKVLKNNSQKLVVKGLQFDGDSAAAICNSLLQHSAKITTARSKITRNSTYRTSI